MLFKDGNNHKIISWHSSSGMMSGKGIICKMTFNRGLNYFGRSGKNE
jgi:hypothetical protein